MLNCHEIIKLTIINKHAEAIQKLSEALSGGGIYSERQWRTDLLKSASM
jgi:hypothetical protein